jgi:hypothetical protein
VYQVTALQRTDDVLKILLAGGEYEDIKQYATTKGWKISERSIRRYMQLAYERLADATNQNLKSLMGRHLMQRRGLYARALKTNDVRTALLVLKDEAMLQGLWGVEIPGHRCLFESEKYCLRPLQLPSSGRSANMDLSILIGYTVLKRTSMRSSSFLYFLAASLHANYR